MERLIRHTNAYKTQRLYALQGKLRHAYFLLFPGSGSLREVLKIFATLFFERNAKTETDRARVESLIKKESYADCIFYPEAGKKFSVADAEAVEEECILRPVEGETKLFVIGDFSEATKEAQNKMLKMLEEPPEGVSFLLGATSSFSVLPTVLSRSGKNRNSGFFRKRNHRVSVKKRSFSFRTGRGVMRKIVGRYSRKSARTCFRRIF